MSGDECSGCQDKSSVKTSARGLEAIVKNANLLPPNEGNSSGSDVPLKYTLRGKESWEGRNKSEVHPTYLERRNLRAFKDFGERPAALHTRTDVFGWVDNAQ